MLIGSFILSAIICPSQSAPRTATNAAWNINFEEAYDPKKYYGKWENHTYFPSPEDWRSLSIYQLITDRYNDGDPSNNEALKTGFDPRDLAFRHGGDFRGLANKLHYIKGLGCQAVWISPIFQNGNNFYDQYSQLDFTLLDQRFGTLEDLRYLTTVAHELGMYIIIDVVMNHMANELYSEGHHASQAPFRFHERNGKREYRLFPRADLPDPQGRTLYDTPAGKQPYADFWYNNTYDPDFKYPGPVYTLEGWEVHDTNSTEGTGSYPWSDFHHNGDLADYEMPWEIHFGKIYGTMDDLRMESERVQEKYIAMTKALISSTDVDGFRIDTPMQVPLSFFKVWCPAMRAHAKSLGKERFGLFGEFFVTPPRYATMTGRGRNRGQYGGPYFIDNITTIKGGIVYAYYWYLFFALVQNLTEYADGLPLAWNAEKSMLDTWDPMTGRKEYAMWNFCNNHDSWRMQSLSSMEHLKLCLTVITFWPGCPLHYAGDEQDLNTPGSALDGWAREELGVSIAYKAIPTRGDHNPADLDNFDMTYPTYRFIQTLNAYRRAYFGNFGRDQCDDLELYDHYGPCLVYIRACFPAHEDRLAVLTNFHSLDGWNVTFPTRWPAGTRLGAIIDQHRPSEKVPPWDIVVQEGGKISTYLPPLTVVVLAMTPAKPVVPAVVGISPRHGISVTNLSQIQLNFSKPMHPSVIQSVRLDGQNGTFQCVTVLCRELVADVDFSNLSNGFHTVEVAEGVQAQDGLGLYSVFRSTFLVARKPNVLQNPGLNVQPGLICNGFTEICHNTPGASWLRIGDNKGNWSKWRKYEERSQWQSVPGLPTLVQYHAEGSAAYVVGDCVRQNGARCFSSWHYDMHLRGDWNDWGFKGDGQMDLVDDYVWGQNLTITGFNKARFAPFDDWSKSYGVHADFTFIYVLPVFDPRVIGAVIPDVEAGAEACRQWMTKRGLWNEHQSLASGAPYATNIWMNPLCVAAAPGPNGTTPVDGVTGTCCVLFNDLLLNYTVTSNLSMCRPKPLGGPDQRDAVVKLRPAEPWQKAVMLLMVIFSIGLPVVCAGYNMWQTRKWFVIHAIGQVKSEDLDGDSFVKPTETHLPKTVLCASLEHVIFNARGLAVEATAGGLGKVVEQQGQLHPGHLYSVHPCFHTKEYNFAGEDMRTIITVDDEEHEIVVHKFEVPPEKEHSECHVVYYFVDSPVIRHRPAGMYPAYNCRRDTLVWWSLWSQSIAYLCDELQPDMFQCPDYHNAMAVMYLRHPIPVVVFLHNAEYQGVLGNQLLTSRQLTKMAKIFNVSKSTLWKEACIDGTLNMMLPVVRYIVLHQGGYGVCAVSKNYALEAHQKHPVLWGLAEVHGVENCMPECDRPKIPITTDVGFAAMKRAAKVSVQRKFNLHRDPEAKLFVFLGRWVKQKGVDYIADCVDWLLTTHKKAQLIMFGPIGDTYGRYAAMRLLKVRKSRKFKGRLFVHPGFVKVTKRLKFACDFCLLPSRDEPFGYVDIEFAWYGAVTVGAFKGGLGKVPGYYYVSDNADCPDHCLSCLKRAMSAAMGCDAETYFQMSAAARKTSFPVEVWQKETLGMYSMAMTKFVKRGDKPKFQKLRTRDLAGRDSHMLGEEPKMKRAQFFGDKPDPDSPRGSEKASEAGQSQTSQPSQNSQGSQGTSDKSSDNSDGLPPVAGGPAGLIPPSESTKRKGEFLKPEVTDERLQVVLEQKMKLAIPKSCEDAMRKVHYVVSGDDERRRIPKMLRCLISEGMLIDYVIGTLFVTGPLISALFTGVWGARIAFPLGALQVSEALSVVFWTAMARFGHPHVIMASVSFCRLLLLFPTFWDVPGVLAAGLVGFLNAGDLAFIYFNFMGTMTGDFMTLGHRTAAFACLRTFSEWMLSDFPPYVHDLSSVSIITLMTVFMTFFSFIPGCLILTSPLPYRTFFLPSFQLHFFKECIGNGKGHVLISLMMSKVFLSCADMSGQGITEWRGLEFLPAAEKHFYLGTLLFTTVAATIVAGFIFSHLYDYTMTLCKACLCFIPGQTLLQVLVMLFADDADGLIQYADAIIVASFVLDVFLGMAWTMTVLATCGSRWRFIIFFGTTSFLRSVGRGVSSVLFFLVSGVSHPREWAGSTQGISQILFVLAIGPCLADILLRIQCYRRFDAEVRSILRSKRHEKMKKIIGPIKHLKARKPEPVSNVAIDAEGPAEETRPNAEAPATPARSEGKPLPCLPTIIEGEESNSTADTDQTRNNMSDVHRGSREAVISDLGSSAGDSDDLEVPESWWHTFRRRNPGEERDELPEVPERWWQSVHTRRGGDTGSEDLEQPETWWNAVTRSDQVDLYTHSETASQRTEQTEKWWHQFQLQIRYAVDNESQSELSERPQRWWHTFQRRPGDLASEASEVPEAWWHQWNANGGSEDGSELGTERPESWWHVLRRRFAGGQDEDIESTTAASTDFSSEVPEDPETWWDEVRRNQPCLSIDESDEISITQIVAQLNAACDDEVMPMDSPEPVD